MSENKSENQVLIVDDSRVIRLAANKILQKDFDVIEAVDGEEAWEELQNNPNISVVFSDLGMPNMDGFELLETIRSSDDPILAKIPLIIITGAEETDGTKEKVLGLGATDFITKPFDSITLKSRATAHINYRNEVKSLEKAAAIDKLTGLYREDAFKQQGEQMLAYAQRHNTDITLVRFDIDQFRTLFIKHGKGVAEQIVAKVASFVSEGKRTEDIAARMGVSSFALILSCSDPQGADVVIERICQRVAKLKLKMGKDVFKICFSTGVTSPAIVASDISFSELLSQAESALKSVVDAGGGKIAHYQMADEIKTDTKEEPVLDVNLDELMGLLSKEDAAVSDQQLSHAMQKILPLISAADSRLKLGLSKVILHLKKRL